MTKEGLIKKYGSIAGAAKALGITRSKLRRQLAQRLKAKAVAETKGRKVAEFRSLYDKSYYVPQKVKQALRVLGAGWEYEVEFAKIAGITLQDLNIVREQFVDYLVLVGRDGRRIWCGDKKTAAEMRRMV